MEDIGQFQAIEKYDDMKIYSHLPTVQWVVEPGTK